MAEYEVKFKVFNINDIEKYLNKNQIFLLNQLEGAIERGRLDDKKSFNDYLVCNQDEPYAKQVLNLILTGEDEKNIHGKEFKNDYPAYDMLTVTRKNGLLTIQIPEENIINSLEYDKNVKILDKDKLLDEFAEKIISEESNDGYDDTLLLFKLFISLQEDLIVTSDSIEYLED